MPEEKKGRRLEVSNTISIAMSQYYQDSKIKRPLAWSVVAPNPLNDICQLVGIQVAYPENYACVCAAQHLSEKYCTIAEAHDYKPELCSYIRNNFGFILSGDENPPLGGIVEPDLLLTVSNACLNYLKWFDALHLYFNKPLIIINTPHRMFEHPDPDYWLGYVMREVEEAIVQLEKIGGNKVTQEKLAHSVQLSREIYKYWQAILELQKATPAPTNFPDLGNLLFIPTCLSGTELGVSLIRQAYEEVKQRVASKIGAIPDERHRLLLINIPPWYKLGLANYFAEKGCVFTCEDYFRHIWCTDEIDATDPVEFLAKKALSYGGESIETVYGSINSIIEDVKEYKIDGAVVQVNKSCKILSTGVLDLASIIRDQCNIPVVLLDIDQADERFYSDAEVKLRLDAFFEMLGEG